MTTSRSSQLWTRCLCIAMALALAPLFDSPKFGAVLENVIITLPASISFAVTNVSVSTVGSPNPTQVSYQNLTMLPIHALRVSVKADGDFVPPSGTAIPASRVSWTTSSPVQGTGINGTLSTSVYSPVYESAVAKTSGSVQVAWTLGAPLTPLHAGVHTLTMRWKLEAF